MLAAALLLPTPAPSLEVVVESVSISSKIAKPAQGQLYILVELAPAETPPDLAGWQVAVDLMAPGGEVSFVAPFAEIPPGPDPSPLVTENFLADFGDDNGPTRASATAFLDTGATPFVDGAALMRVPFEVAPGEFGNFAVTLDLDPFAGTVLSDTNAAAISFTAVDGELSVAPPVPTLGFWGIVLLSAFVAIPGYYALRLRFQAPRRF